jgi:hypothetical protein
LACDLSPAQEYLGVRRANVTRAFEAGMLADFGKKEWNASLRAWNVLYLGLTYKSNGLIATKLLVRLKKIL